MPAVQARLRMQTPPATLCTCCTTPVSSATDAVSLAFAAAGSDAASWLRSESSASLRQFIDLRLEVELVEVGKRVTA